MGYKAFFHIRFGSVDSSVIAAWLAPFPKEHEAPENRGRSAGQAGRAAGRRDAGCLRVAPAALLGALAFSKEDGFLVPSWIGLLQSVKIRERGGGLRCGPSHSQFGKSVYSLRGPDDWKKVDENSNRQRGRVDAPIWCTAFLLRYVANGLLSAIPVYGLLDILFVFRPDHRCIHDLIAGNASGRRREAFREKRGPLPTSPRPCSDGRRGRLKERASSSRAKPLKTSGGHALWST